MNNTFDSILGGLVEDTGNRPMTATQIVHRRLRAEIISLKRLPGDPVSEKEIALECGVSRTPIREALLRLSEEKLIDIVPKSGTRVSKIPVASLLEAQVARTALEQVTVRAAAQRAQRSDVANLQATIVLQQEHQEADDTDKFYSSDEALHFAIAVAAGYPGIWRFIERIKLQVDRYRRLTLPQPHRMERVLDEHTEIVEAIAARDDERAVMAMTTHLGGLSAEDLRAIHDTNPNYFIGDINSVCEKWSDGNVGLLTQAAPRLS
ncbi:GntR family transcriptional regulator [Pseudovibrio exalbescens]|uniref:GntR family transcriptional regulator n=1 Tax=Pseudovibrio exalbescens TaxID=197461 RepID=A0A1U7JGA4_9HYPH|nr:GntR family transcriptional regulator [Pseudovibrio exalbescens]OKL43728.1 GntR family transcriptional regulator [Pseudovibrio exalbescens]